MPLPLRRVLVAVVFALLASWAWSPLFEGGLRGDELRALAEAGEPSRSLFAVDGTDGHPLAALSLRLSAHWLAALGGAARAPAWPVRLENAALLLFAAWSVGRFARRVLVPWSGGELARAAGWAAALVFALHPLSVACVASATSRGDLLALALGAACGWAYLRGRQEHSARSLGLALVLAVLAGLSSDVALGLCGWLAGAELASARRHRPMHTRLRSALATLAVGAACIAIDTLARSFALGHFSAPRACCSGAGDGGCALAAATAFERLGTLFVPVNAHVVGAWGFALAGFVALAALQPILITARSAPRLWGWMLLAWVVALAFAELCAPSAGVNPEDMRAAGTLASAVVVLSIGLAVSITSLSGLRRVVLPLVVALAYAALGHANALAYRAAAREVAALAPLLALEDGARHVLVVDAPATVAGVTACAGALPWLAPEGLDARAASTEAVCALAREPEFEALRSAGLALVVRPRALLLESPAAWTRVRLGAPKPTSGARTWYREGRSPELDVEPATTAALVVRAASGTDTARPPVVAWRTGSAGDPASESGRAAGVWAYVGEAPEAVFDLSSSLAWLATPRVVQVWSAEGWSRIGSAELFDALQPPQIEARPRVEGGAWVFAATAGAAFDGGDERRAWVLALLDPRTLERSEFAALRVGDALRFDGAAAAAARGARWWTLETRVDGHALERLRGRAAE